MRRAIFLLMISQLLLASPVAAWADILSGFDNGVGWTPNTNGTGGPTFADNSLTLTDGGFGEARSAFYNTPQDVVTHGFFAQFDYQVSGGAGSPADGFAFVIQNDSRGVNALGGNGNALGQGIQSSTPDIVPIHPSVAVLFNILGGSGTQLVPPGVAPPPFGYIATTPVNLASGDKIHVELSYPIGGGVLTETLRDVTTNQVFPQSFPVNIQSILPDVGTHAFVGFTGSTGGAVSTQVISNFSLISIPELDPGSLASALTLLGGGVLTVSGRRRRK